MTRKELTADYRWRIAARCVAAIVGGFALTSVASIVLALALVRSGAMSRMDATATATLTSFALWVGVTMWAFSAASVRRVWLNLFVPTIVLSLLGWWLRGAA